MAIRVPIFISCDRSGCTEKIETSVHPAAFASTTFLERDMKPHGWFRYTGGGGNGLLVCSEACKKLVMEGGQHLNSWE